MAIMDVIRRNPKRAILWVLAVGYLVGAGQHLFNLWQFYQGSIFPDVWTQARWIVLVVLEVWTPATLVSREMWGVIAMHLIAAIHVVVHLFTPSFLYREPQELIIFSILGVLIYWKLVARQKKTSYRDSSKEKVY